MYELKIYKGVLCPGNEEWWEIWRRIDPFVQNRHDEFDKNLIRKNLHFNRLLLTKVYNVWVQKSIEELYLMVLKTDAKIDGKLTCAF